MEKISGAIVGTWMLNLLQIFYLFFIFGSAMVKIINCIFPPRRSWKIYFKKIKNY